MKFGIFVILPDPGCPRDPKVGSHSDCMVSWDTLGGIGAVVCPQGPPQAGFEVPQKRGARKGARLVGHFGLVKVKFGIILILPDLGSRVDPNAGSHSDVECFLSVFHMLGPLQTSFWVPARRSRRSLGSFVRQI